MDWLKGNEAAIIGLVQKHGFAYPHAGRYSSLDLDYESADILVLVSRASKNHGYLGLVKLEDDLADLLGMRVEVNTEKMIPERDRERVLKILTPVIAKA